MNSFTETKIPGIFKIELFHSLDKRGTFVKNYHKDALETHGLIGEFHEGFYSVNQKGVIRGMHFQHPPHDQAKLVYCSSGTLLDVVLDIRKGSPTYGQWLEIELSGANYTAVYLPKGIAHGFVVLSNFTSMHYLTSTVHVPESDDGIRMDSFGYRWPVDNPIRSSRDMKFQDFEALNSPFTY